MKTNAFPFVPNFNNSMCRKLLCPVGSIFSVVPWYNFEKRKLNKTPLYKLWAVLCGAVFGSLIVLGAYMHLLFLQHNDIEKIMLTIYYLAMVIGIEYLIFNSAFIKIQKWYRFLKLICEFELFSFRPVKKIECRYFSVLYWVLILGHIFFIAIYFLYGYRWFCIFGGWSILTTVSSMILEYYCYICALISGNFVLVIWSYYEVLNRIMDSRAESYFSKPVRQRREEDYIKNIRCIGRYYRKVSDIVQRYNDVFGFVTFVLFYHSVLQILRCCSLILKILGQPDVSWLLFFSAVLMALGSSAESAFVIMCCEKASAAGRKTKELCYKIQDDFDTESKQRKELFKLAEVLETYKPKFTAANFFVIDQGTILQIVSISTTYLIVFIQFCSTVNDKYLSRGKQ